MTTITIDTSAPIGMVRLSSTVVPRTTGGRPSATVAVAAPTTATTAPVAGPNTGTTNGSAMATHTTNITAHTSGRLGSRGPFVPSAPLTGSPSESIHIAGTASVGDATDVNAIAAATAIPT